MSMTKLNVRFSDETKKSIEDLSNQYDCSNSFLARLAMDAGLAILKNVSSSHSEKETKSTEEQLDLLK